MSDEVEFSLKLVNEFSAPATQAKNDIDEVSKALADVGKASAETDKATKSLEDLAREIRNVQLAELKAQRSGASDELLKELADKRKKLQLDSEILKIEQQIEAEKATSVKTTGKVTKSLEDLAREIRNVQLAELKAQRSGAPERIIKELAQKRKRLLLDVEILKVEKEIKAAQVTSVGMMAGIAGVAAEVAGKVIDIAKAAASMAVQFGKATVEAAALKSNLIGGLEVTLGSRDAAKGLAKELLGFKGAALFDSRALIGSGQRLARAGFAEDEIVILAKAMADLASFSGNTGAFETITGEIERVRKAGKFDRAALEAIANAGGTAITPEEVIEELSRRLGKSSKEIDQLLKGQGVGVDTGLAAVVRTIRENIGGGKVGGFAASQADTIPGLIAQLRGKFFDLVPAVEDSPGLQRFQGVLREIVNLLDEANPLGQRLKKAFDDLVNRGFTAIFGKVDPKGAVEKLVSGFEKLSKVVPPIIAALRGFGEGYLKGITPMIERWVGPLEKVGDSEDGVLKAAEAGKKLGEAIGWIADEFNKISTSGGPSAMLAEAGIAIGKSFIEGIFEGIEDKFTEKYPRLSKLFRLLPKAARDELQTQSPSRVMMAIGEDTVEGFMLPLQRAANDVYATMADVVAPPEVPRLMAAAGGVAAAVGWGGGSVAPVINVHVEAPGATKDDAETMGARIGEVVRIELVRVLEEVGLAAGAA